MKCACKDPACKNEIFMDSVSHMITIDLVNPDGSLRHSAGVYLDANTCVQLIKQLRDTIRHLSDGDEL